MDTNKFFSFPRIAMVMKREIMENWKTNLYRLIGIYAGFLLVMVFTMSKQASSYSDPQVAFQHYCSNVLGAFVLIIGIFGIVYAANIMENMITKEKRIAFLMLTGNHDREICGTVLNCYGRTGGGCLCCGVIGGNYPLSVTPFI